MWITMINWIEDGVHCCEAHQSPELARAWGMRNLTPKGIIFDLYDTPIRSKEYSLTM